MGRRTWSEIFRAWPALLFSLAVTVAFAWQTHLVDNGFYAKDTNFRYQTRAFLSGTLRVQGSPVKHRHDWAWNDGMSQIWGLGVPLLRLPLEAAAQVFGAPFPDRLVFLLVYFITAFLIYTIPLGRERYLLREGLVLLALLNPWLLSLVGGTHFWVYEEGIAYNCVWALLTLAVALHVQARPTRWGFVIVGACGGFAFLIRPTGALYGALTLGLLLFFVRMDRRTKLLAVVAFCLAPVFALVTNELRFGSSFSFGHALSLANETEVDFGLRWGFPFQSERFWRAAKELAGALYSFSAYQSLKSSTYRYRELYFAHYFDWTLFAFLATSLAILTPWARKRVRDVRLRLLALWSLVAFVVLFVFYARAIGLVSRYISDFVPAVVVGLGLGAVIVWDRVLPLVPVRVRRHLLPVLLLGLGFAIASYWTGWKHPENVTAAGLPAQLDPWNTTSPVMPERYFCTMDSDFKKGIFYNGNGWDIGGRCGVGETTELFFENPECVEFAYERFDDALHTKAPPTIHVRDGLVELAQVSDATEGGTRRLVFCRGPAFPVRPKKYSSLHLVTIGWVTPEQVGAFLKPNVKLLWVKRTK